MSNPNARNEWAITHGVFSSPGAPTLGTRPPFDRITEAVLLRNLRRSFGLSYTEQTVADILAAPAGRTSGDVFDEPVSNAGILSMWGMACCWGREPAAAIAEPESARVRLDYEPGRSAYEGPLYLQGPGEPTCNAWAAIHALLAIGLEPDLGLFQELLNGALPRPDGTEGIHTLSVWQKLMRHNTSLVVDHPMPLYGTFSVRYTAKIIKDTIDNHGAVMVGVKAKKEGSPGHAVCVAGYNFSEWGHMDVQVIDSGCGAGALTIESLTGELGGQLIPLTTIAHKPTK